MTSEKKILDILKDNNPFTSSSAGDPTGTRYPDVPGLGDDVLFGLKSLIAKKSRPPHEPCAGMVQAESGFGKTHLIGRLIDDSENPGTPFSFAYIHPLIDPHKAFRYLLKHIVNNLNKKPKNGPPHTQLEILGAQIFTRVIGMVAEESKIKKLSEIHEKIKNHPLKALKSKMNETQRKTWLKKTYDFLLKQHVGEIHPDFLSVFLQYFFYEKRRVPAILWLMGEMIDEESVQILGVPDRSVLEPESLEDDARLVLRSLDILLTHYSNRTLVVFFDQLENLHAKPVVEQWCSLIWFLCDICQSMLPLAFLRTMDWQEKIQSDLANDMCRRRLESNIFELKGGTKEQGLKLIQSRLDMVLGDLKRPDPLFPFLSGQRQELDKVFVYDETPPGRVIKKANQVLKLILASGSVPPVIDPPISPEEILARAFETKHLEILAHFDDYPPDEGQLTLALEQYLTHRPEDGQYRVTDLSGCADQVKYIDLAGRISPRDSVPAAGAFLVDVERHHAAVAASLRKGLLHIEKNAAGQRTVFIRDGRCLFPQTWKKNQEYLEELKKSHGLALILSKDHAARWYALAHLKFDLEAGDITMPEGRSITWDEFASFIKNKVNGRNFEAFQKLDDYLHIGHTNGPAPPPPRPEKNVLGLAVRLLDKAPGKIMKASFLAQAIAPKIKTDLPTALLLEIIGQSEEKDRFNTFGHQDGVLVQLRLVKHAQN